MEPYRTFEHTADIGIEAYGATVESAFANVARGMFAIIVNDSDIESHEERTITLPVEDDLEQLVESHEERTLTLPVEDDLEQLVVDWLSELIYIYDVDGLVFVDFSITITDKLQATTTETNMATAPKSKP